ncbi:MAG: Gx transporter family protein, partial [Oceanococcus sp.]
WALASWVVFIRVIASSLLLGTFMTPSFFLSAGGAVCSVLALGALWRWNALGLPRFSTYGFGLLSACSHMCGQFLLAYTLFIPHAGLIKLLPVLLLSSFVFGLFSAWLASNIHQQMPPPAAS